MYTAAQAGAFVSEDKGENWNPLHVMISTTTNCTEGFSHCNHQVDRVGHDFQVRSLAHDLQWNYRHRCSVDCNCPSKPTSMFC
jgi:hypothetical protein